MDTKEGVFTFGIDPPPTQTASSSAQAATEARIADIVAKLRAAFVTSADLAALQIEERPRILGEWMRAGDLGLIFAARGVGKSWLSMLMADAIAECRPLGQWEQGDAEHRVVYLDAEMNLPDTKKRSMALGLDRPGWLQNELVFDNLGRGLNIADPEDQAALERFLEPGDVFFIDNLSTAAAGMEENNNDDWERVRDWLLRLRRRTVTVILIHHAGRNGEMRGASRREDMAHWVMKLEKDGEEDGPTAITSTFTKCRNCQASAAPPLRWRLYDHSGHITYDCQRMNNLDRMLGLIVDGVETAKELAEELEVSKGCVSKWARKLESQGTISIEGGKYYPKAA